MNENDDKDNEDNVGSDSRRVSKVVRPKSKLKGVLNIDDKSENEDIEFLLIIVNDITIFSEEHH